MSFQKQKQLILSHYAAIDAAKPSQIIHSLQQRTASDWLWRGFSPCHQQIGAEAVAKTFWIPLHTSFSKLQRRQQIFLAGANQIDSFQSIWVVSLGHLVGLFDKPLWGIPATTKLACLPYAEFNQIQADRIIQTACYFDLPQLMKQAGLEPFLSSQQTAAELLRPAPQTQDGLYLIDQDPKQAQHTLASIKRMVQSIGRWQQKLPLEDELRQDWHEDMSWWGPTGIGSTYTIDRYARQHAAPFRAAFSERSETTHICRLAEGDYGGFFGWPNFTARHVGDFLGIKASHKTTEFRVLDIYRRQDQKLIENWVFIDLIYWLQQVGYDVLANH